jgi:hypothetical protein
MSVISATGAERPSLDFQPVAKTCAALFLLKAVDTQSRRSGNPDVRLYVSAETKRQAALPSRCLPFVVGGSRRDRRGSVGLERQDVIRRLRRRAGGSHDGAVVFPQNIE